MAGSGSEEKVVFSVGDTVLVHMKHKATVKYVGPTDFAAGVWIGLSMEKKVGKHDGTVMGKLYFHAEPLHGTFTRSDVLTKFDQKTKDATMIQGLGRIADARNRTHKELVSTAFNRLDADDEARQLLRQSNLATTALGLTLNRSPPTQGALDKWAQEAQAVVVSESYEGATLSLPITEDQVWALMKSFIEGRTLHFKYATLLLTAFMKWAEELPSLIELSVPENSRLTVIGDTHGQLEDLYTIFSLNGVPSPTNLYIANGDFVDRGAKGVEITLSLMAWCLCLAPTLMGPGTPIPCLLHRGNHEGHSQNASGGFMTEVLLKYSFGTGGSHSIALSVYDAFQAAFHAMPLASTISPAGAQECERGVAVQLTAKEEEAEHLVHHDHSASPLTPCGGVTTPYKTLAPPPPPFPLVSPPSTPPPPRVFVVHGGLFNESTVSLKHISEVSRKRDIPYGAHLSFSDKVFEDLMWSDPRLGLHTPSPSDRGAGVFFGANTTRTFCALNALSLVVRSHEMVQDGCEWMHDGQLVTVFSASRYTGKGDNKGGFITFDSNLRFSTTSFMALPLHATMPRNWSGSVGLLPAVKPHFPALRAESCGKAPTSSSAQDKSLQELVRRMIMERIILRKSDLYFFYSDRAHHEVSREFDGTVSKCTWAEGLKTVLALDLPWLGLAPTLASIEPNGRINYSKFLDRYSIAMRPQDLSWMEAILEKILGALLESYHSLEAVFRHIDVDDSGSISISELEKVLVNLQLGLTRPQILIIMNSLDIDRDGQIKFTEFSKRFHFTVARIKDEKLADNLGSNGEAKRVPVDGDSLWIHSNFASISKALHRGEEVSPENVFSSLDHDGDGLLTHSELFSFIQSLNLNLTTPEIEMLVHAVDINNSGFINIQEVRHFC